MWYARHSGWMEDAASRKNRKAEKRKRIPPPSTSPLFSPSVTAIRQLAIAGMVETRLMAECACAFPPYALYAVRQRHPVHAASDAATSVPQQLYSTGKIRSVSHSSGEPPIVGDDVCVVVHGDGEIEAVVHRMRDFRPEP